MESFLPLTAVEVMGSTGFTPNLIRSEIHSSLNVRQQRAQEGENRVNRNALAHVGGVP
jgi:hypothetical protein